MRRLVNLRQLRPEEAQLSPRRARQVLTEPIPKYELPANGMEPDLACRLIHDELLLDGSTPQPRDLRHHLDKVKA